MGFKKRSPIQIKYSQNFITSNNLSKKITDTISISKDDTVIEIGPGKGALTKDLLLNCKNLIAVEKDYRLCSTLLRDLGYFKNLEVVNDDFLKFKISLKGEYKVVGNIPFFSTSDILKKVLETYNPPVQTYLIMQKEAAERFLGSSIERGKDSLFSLRFKPFFDSEILLEFDKNDFNPRPNVNTVLVKICKRKMPLVSKKELYLDFITFCITAWKGRIKDVLPFLFSKNEIYIFNKDYNINLNLRPTELKFKQWLIIYNTFLEVSSEVQMSKIHGAFAKLKVQQSKLEKRNRTSLAFQRKKRI